MPWKHQDRIYREGGKWVCWSDGLVDELTFRIVADIRAQGFKVRRRKNTVFVLAVDAARIKSNIRF